MIRFTVPGPPVAQARPRIVKKGQHYGMANTEVCDNYRAYFRLIASQHRPPKPIDKACKVTIDIYVAKPKSWPKRRIHANVKPDIDNAIKMFLDAMDGVIFENDSRVIELHVKKHLDAIPRVEVQVEEMS